MAGGNVLHRKSEHYCSKMCYENYQAMAGQDKPPFLSKWKIRKRKTLRDPFVKLRQKTRTKTKALLTQGRLKKKPCAVCHSHNVLPHHEDYTNPYAVIWLCESHHTAYHNGEIRVFNGRLQWNPERLIPKGQDAHVSKKKYQKLRDDYHKNTNKKNVSSGRNQRDTLKSPGEKTGEEI